METTKEEKDEDVNPIEQMYVSVRSAVFGVILLVFAVTKIPFAAEQIDKYSNKDEKCKELCENLFCYDLCDYTSQTLTAYSVMVAGLALMIIFSFVGIVQSVNPQAKCGEKKSICGMIRKTTENLLQFIPFLLYFFVVCFL